MHTTAVDLNQETGAFFFFFFLAPSNFLLHSIDFVCADKTSTSKLAERGRQLGALRRVWISSGRSAPPTLPLSLVPQFNLADM